MERDELGRRIKEVKPLVGMRKMITDRLTYSKHTYPQGTGQVYLDVTKLIEFRKELLEKKGIKVSFGDIYVKAAACAVEDNMTLNASRRETEIIYYDDINITVSAQIGEALMEPVLMHADQKDVEEISAELKKIYENLRKGKLMKVKLEGGTFAVTNIGIWPIDVQQPFVSPPQCAIMGVGRNRRLPVYDENDNIVPANLTNFALTIDHGTNDGKMVAGFFTSIQKVLEDPWTWLYHKRESAAEA